MAEPDESSGPNDATEPLRSRTMAARIAGDVIGIGRIAGGLKVEARA